MTNISYMINKTRRRYHNAGSQLNQVRSWVEAVRQDWWAEVVRQGWLVGEALWELSAEFLFSCVARKS